MDAILLAGGFGTRLRPLTYTRPKPLLPVAGRPMVEWVLDRLPPEVHRVIVAVNWKAQALGSYFQTREPKKGQRLEFVVVREEEPLGTAGAVKNCEAHLTGERFFVLNADIVSDMDLGAMLRAHKAHGGPGTISLKEVPAADVVHFGVIEPGLQVETGAIPIKGFVEKPKDPALAPSRLINAGAYLLERRVLDLIPRGKLVSMEKEIFPHLIPQGFYGMPMEGRWVDVGDPARLLTASHMLNPNFTTGPRSRIDASAHLVGSVAGRDCFVGPDAVVERSVLGDSVTVKAGVKLTECVVGDGETVSADANGARIWTRQIPAGYPKQQVGNAL